MLARPNFDGAADKRGNASQTANASQWHVSEHGGRFLQETREKGVWAANRGGGIRAGCVKRSPGNLRKRARKEPK